MFDPAADAGCHGDEGHRLSFQGITIDLAAATSRAVDFRIDTNICLEGESVGDSSSVQILDALKRSATTDIVVVDLKEGKAWWETRLLVLVAGAVRTGKPRSVVFVASTTRQSKAFLGWAPPRALLDALLDRRNPRHATYLKAQGLALESDRSEGVIRREVPACRHHHRGNSDDTVR